MLIDDFRDKLIHGLDNRQKVLSSVSYDILRDIFEVESIDNELPIFLDNELFKNITRDGFKAKMNNHIKNTNNKKLLLGEHIRLVLREKREALLFTPLLSKKAGFHLLTSIQLIHKQMDEIIKDYNKLIISRSAPLDFAIISLPVKDTEHLGILVFEDGLLNEHHDMVNDYIFKPEQQIEWWNVFSLSFT